MCSGTGELYDPLSWDIQTCPMCGGYGFEIDDDDDEPNPLAWLEELDEDDPLRTGESEWERGIRRGTST